MNEHTGRAPYRRAPLEPAGLTEEVIAEITERYIPTLDASQAVNRTRERAARIVAIARGLENIEDGALTNEMQMDRVIFHTARALDSIESAQGALSMDGTLTTQRDVFQDRIRRSHAAFHGHLSGVSLEPHKWDGKSLPIHFALNNPPQAQEAPTISSKAYKALFDSGFIRTPDSESPSIKWTHQGVAKYEGKGGLHVMGVHVQIDEKTGTTLNLLCTDLGLLITPLNRVPQLVRDGLRGLGFTK